MYAVRACSFVVALAAALACGEAHAQPSVTVETAHYAINGKTGAELYRDMVRRGPRHGWLSKAIAQTKYTVTPRGDMVHERGVCRVRNGGYKLHIVYTYPQPRNPLSGALARRWKAFLAETVVHEKRHGELALAMARELDRKIRGFQAKDSSDCWRASDRLERELSAVFQAHEKKQIAFDRDEHRDGGAVEKNAMRLIGEK